MGAQPDFKAFGKSLLLNFEGIDSDADSPCGDETAVRAPRGAPLFHRIRKQVNEVETLGLL